MQNDTILQISFVMQGTVSFLLGLFFIFVRWPIVGIIFEMYGCIGLFGLVSIIPSYLFFA